MRPYVDDPDFTLYHGDARHVLRELDEGLAQCIVTSPPYYLLRDYDEAGQIGMEQTLEEYVGALVDVFSEARRVLRDDGTLWLNLGDTYAAAPRGPRHGRTSRLSTPERQERVSPVVNKRGRAGDAKPKDLMLVPFEVALALRADGWWLRQVIVWDKPNPIPESAKDRPTTSHEYVLLLSKRRRYWYDKDAIAEPATWERWGAQTMQKDVVGKAKIAKRQTKEELAAKWPGISQHTHGARLAGAGERGDESEPMDARLTRNARSVWRGSTAQFPDAHFAVMPGWLAERCILAGCPESVCVRCGCARVRITGHDCAECGALVPTQAKGCPACGFRNTGWREQRETNPATRAGESETVGPLVARRTDLTPRNRVEGWSDCGCGADFQPGIVLDPFAGAGTTALAARKLGRRSIGIELSEASCAIAAARLAQQPIEGVA